MVKWVDMCCGSVIPMGTLVGGVLKAPTSIPTRLVWGVGALCCELSLKQPLHLLQDFPCFVPFLSTEVWFSFCSCSFIHICLQVLTD